VVTVLWVLWDRMRATREARLALTSEAVWGMIAFAVIPVLASVAVLVPAWASRTPRAGGAWDVVDVEAIGGAAE
jgi:hypothetical protein